MCECKVVFKTPERLMDQGSIVYCGLHGAAPEMLSALVEIEAHDPEICLDGGCAEVFRDIARNAIDQARSGSAQNSALNDVCIAGNPATFGVCGDTDCVCYSPARTLAAHVLAMSDDAYLVGHPEWSEIVADALAVTTVVKVEPEPILITVCGGVCYVEEDQGHEIDVVDFDVDGEDEAELCKCKIFGEDTDLHEHRGNVEPANEVKP